MASKYQVVVEAIVKPESVQKELDKMSNKYILNLKAKIDFSDIEKQLAGVSTKIAQIVKKTQDAGRTGGGGSGTPGGGINVNPSIAAVEMLQRKVIQLQNTLKSPVKYDISTSINEDMEKITTATLGFNDSMGMARTETYRWVEAMDEAGNKEANWQQVSGHYTEDNIKKERLKQAELKKTEALVARMTQQADNALARTQGRKLDVPEVQKVIQAANALKAAASAGDVEGMKKFSNETKNAVSAMGNLGKNTLSWTQSMNTALEKIVQWGISTMLIYGTIQKIRDATEYIKELDKELTNVGIVTGANSAQINSLAQQYNNLASQLGSTTLEVAKGSVEWFRQGKTVAETSKLMQTTMMMSKLGNMESAEATEALTAIINGFKLEAEDTVGVLDKLIALDNKYATSTAEISDAMRRSANSAQQAGVTFDELASYITVVSATTRKSAESIGESFKTIFARMENIKLGKMFEDDTTNINDVEKALSLVNIKIRDTETSFRPMGDVMDEIAAKWETINPLEQNAIANAIAGIRQRENFIAVMRNYDKVLEAQKIAQDSAGTSAERFGVYLESLEAKANQFTAAWEKLVYSTVHSEFIKWTLDAGIAVLQFAEAVGVGNVVTVAAFSFLATKIFPLLPPLIGLLNSLAASITLVSVSAGTLAAVFGAGLGLVVVAAYFAFNKLNDTMVDTYQTFETAKGVFEANKTELSSLADEYEKLANKTNKTSAETNRLLEIQTLANSKYSALSSEVDLFSDATSNNTEEIKKNVAWLREQQKVQDEIFLEQNKKAYDEAGSELEGPGKRREAGRGGFAGNLYEYRRELQRRLLVQKDIFGLNQKELDSVNQQIAAAENLRSVYEYILDTTIGISDNKGRSAGRDRSRTPAYAMEQEAAAANELEEKYQELSDMVSGTLSKSFDDFAEKQDELGVKLATLRAKLEEASSYKPKTPEGIQKQKEEIGKLNAEIAETSKAMEENAAVHEMATRRILFDILLQQISQQNLTGEVATAAYKMAYDLAASWGLIDQRTAEVMGHISGAVNQLSTQEVPVAITNIQQLMAWIQSVAGDYTIRFNVITTYSQIKLPQGGDPKTGYPPGYEPTPPEDGSSYYPGGFDPVGGGGAAPKKEQEKTYSASNLYQMIIDLIRQEKQAEIDLLKVKQESIKLEQQALEDQQKALDDQLDSYGEIIDSRKEILRTEQDELSYQEEIADRNKSIAKLQNELAVLALDNSAESKARQLELQEDLDNELNDLAKTQRDHSYDEQEDALDREYDLYEENINKQKQILQEQSDLLDVQFELVQTQIDAIEEFLSKSGLVGQEAIKRISELTPALYEDLIAWNQEYGSGIEEDVVRAWEEAEKAIKKYKDVVDAIRGESEFGGDSGIGGGGGGNLNWKRQYGLVPGTALWDEALKLGKKKFLDKHPEIKKHHTGLDSGPVGELSTPTNEVFTRLMRGEVVLKDSDMLNILSKIPIMAQNLSNMRNSGGGDLTIQNLINVQGNLSKDAVPDIERISKAVVKELNKVLIQRGYNRGTQLFST